jgi:Type II secretion system (T2SS), protein M subtype b
MIALPMSDRDRRVLVLGGAAILLIVAVARGLPALRVFAAERRAETSRTTELLAHREWLSRNARGLEHELVRVCGQLAAYDSALVEGETPSTASARLAQLVSDAVSETDARLASIRMSADSAARSGDLAHVVAYASVSGDLTSLATVLQLLEEGPHLLSVSELSIASTQPAVARTQAEQLQAELVVHGLYRRATRLGTSR